MKFNVEIENSAEEEVHAACIPAPHVFLGSDVTAAYRLRDLAADEDVELSKLAAVIESSEVLSEVFLAAANSAFFGLRTPASTVRRALLTLGMTRISRIANDIVLSIETVESSVKSSSQSVSG